MKRSTRYDGSEKKNMNYEVFFTSVFNSELSEK